MKRAPSHHGLSLLELLLALSITAMVAVAIAGMLGAVSSGANCRRDSRAVTVLANAAAARLSSYIVPSRCILALDGADLTLWLNDSRESGTVHATEIRWLRFDGKEGEIVVHYVKFPDGWSQAAQDLEDLEYPLGTDWSTVLASYDAMGWTGSRTIIDELTNAAIQVNEPTAIDSRFVTCELSFATDSGEVPVVAGATISQHAAPVQ